MPAWRIQFTEHKQMRFSWTNLTVVPTATASPAEGNRGPDVDAHAVADHRVFTQLCRLQGMGLDKHAAPAESATTVPEAAKWGGRKGRSRLRVDQRVLASGQIHRTDGLSI